MSFLRLFLNGFETSADIECNRVRYANDMEYVKGFLGDHPREKLQALIASERCFRTALLEIKEIAIFELPTREFHPIYSTALRAIRWACDQALHPNLQEPTQESTLP